jgi:Zn-dependent protease with chaperone function
VTHSTLPDVDADAPIQALLRLKPNSIRRPKVPPLYLVNLWLVTGLCILIPIVYLGLIAALGWLEIQYYSHWVPSLAGGGRFLRVVAWLLPGFIGTVLMLFLLKPFFAPRQKVPEAVPLAKGEEVAFTSAIRALCAAVGIRAPAQIRLSHQVNAWVQFDGGLLGFLLGRKLVTVGMPLVASMSSRQLVGVLAHEFGHFAQAAAMRCVYIINTVNGWLYSRAYQRDEWDDRLERWSSEADGGFQLWLMLTGFCLWLTRRFLHLLFQVSFRMSRRLSQQMEFDADRYEATLAGSDCFRTTALRLRGISRAWGETDTANASAWREGRLVEDLPAAIDLRFSRLDEREWHRIAEDLDSDHETQFWASHPADQERIANVEQLGCAGLFLDERPARLLFEDFPVLAKRVTAHYYEGMGLAFGPRNLIAAQDLWKVNRLDDAQSEAFARYSNGMIGEALLLSPEEAKYTPASNFDWQGAVDELRRVGPETLGMWKRLQRRRDRANELALWIALIDQDIDFLMPDGRAPDNAGMRQEYADCTSAEHPDERLAKRVLALFARRLHFAVEALPESERARALQALDLMQAMHGLWPTLKKLEESRQVLLRLFGGMSGSAGELRQSTYQRAVQFRADWAKVFETLDGLSFEGASLGKQLRNRCGHLPSGGDDPLEFLRGITPLEDAFVHVNRSLLAGLIELAEPIERERGIRPIKLLLKPAAAVPA